MKTANGFSNNRQSKRQGLPLSFFVAFHVKILILSAVRAIITVMVICNTITVKYTHGEDEKE